jgi:hypothetical protein
VLQRKDREVWKRNADKTDKYKRWDMNRAKGGEEIKVRRR